MFCIIDVLFIAVTNALCICSNYTRLKKFVYSISLPWKPMRFLKDNFPCIVYILPYHLLSHFTHILTISHSPPHTHSLTLTSSHSPPHTHPSHSPPHTHLLTFTPHTQPLTFTPHSLPHFHPSHSLKLTPSHSTPSYSHSFTLSHSHTLKLTRDHTLTPLIQSAPPNRRPGAWWLHHGDGGPQLSGAHAAEGSRQRCQGNRPT